MNSLRVRRWVAMVSTREPAGTLPEICDLEVQLVVSVPPTEAVMLCASEELRSALPAALPAC